MAQLTIPLDHVTEVMRREKLPLYRVRNGNDNIAANEDKTVDIETAVRDLETFIYNLEGNGLVEIALSDKSARDIAGKGGNIKFKYLFTVKVGSNGVSSLPLQGLPGDKELRTKLETALEELRTMKEEKAIQKIEDKYAARIAALENKEEEIHPVLAGLLEMGKPYIAGIMAKVAGVVPGAPATPYLAGVVKKIVPAADYADQEEEGEEEEEEQQDQDELEDTAGDRFDTAVDRLEVHFGLATLADVFTDLADAADKDAAKLKGYFSLIKSIT